MSAGKPAERNKDWFSWRHQTSEAHEAAQIRRQAREAEWQATMEENAQARAQRSPAQQLAVLDKRLGKGKGAVRERARLAAQIEGRKNRKKGRK